ncbi:MAG: LuxR C-terminal-related transcriptional regulator [Nocardiopsaceae bacterium]|nr:LuxR C-terminal-related transcriptional regulator [Nocardiopsaceae bacterium]
MAPQSAPARQNLPLDPDSFIGRDRDLSDLLRLLDTDRVLTLCGASGIGKTRLALRLAVQATGSFPDGVWLAALEDVSSCEEIASRIATAVGVTEEVGHAPADTLREALRSRRLLVVLDGCGHITDHVAAVGRALIDSCPEVSLLITSEEPVHLDGEAIWRVPPLSLPPWSSDRDPARSEAVRLFLDRARTSAPGFEAAAGELRVIADICRRIGGIPLCIELVAAWVRRLPLAQIAAELAERIPLSAGNGRPKPGRSTILRIVLEWSHALLSDCERTMLRRLSVFPDWDLDLAEGVCSMDPLREPDVLDLVSALVDHSLITIIGEHEGRVRYRLLGPIRRFASARLAAAGEEAAIRERHAEQMVAIAEALGRATVLGRAMPWPERFAYWRRAVAEYGNLRSALHWCAAHGRIHDGLRLCTGLRPFWITGYHFAEGSYWSDLFLGMEGGSQSLRGRVMVRRAELAWAQHDHEGTVHFAEEGLRRCREAGDTQSVALALNLLAMVGIHTGEHDRVEAHLVEVQKLARETGDLWNEAVSLGTQGTLTARRGDFAGADTLYNTALMIMRGMDHRWGVGATLIRQGVVAEEGGDLLGADRCYREALDLQRSMGITPGLARCLTGVGRIAHALGSTAQAYDYLSESLLLSRSTGQRSGVAATLASIARIAADQGLAEEAYRLAGAADALWENAGRPRSVRPRTVDSAEGDGLDASASASWREEGRGLDIDEAVAMALRVTDAGRAPRQRPVRAQSTEPPEKVLTRREHEIAQLIGQDQSNRMISEQLFITTTTVARHVANINRKMGFNSRKQIAAWINRRIAD